MAWAAFVVVFTKITYTNKSLAVFIVARNIFQCVLDRVYKLIIASILFVVVARYKIVKRDAAYVPHMNVVHEYRLKRAKTIVSVAKFGS